jgi:hypothetical protein
MKLTMRRSLDSWALHEGQRKRGLKNAAAGLVPQFGQVGRFIATIAYGLHTIEQTDILPAVAAMPPTRPPPVTALQAATGPAAEMLHTSVHIPTSIWACVRLSEGAGSKPAAHSAVTHCPAPAGDELLPMLDRLRSILLIPL